MTQVFEDFDPTGGPAPKDKKERTGLAARAETWWRGANGKQRAAAIAAGTVAAIVAVSILGSLLPDSSARPTPDASSAPTTTAAPAAPLPPQLVLRKDDRPTDDLFRAMDADIHPIVFLVAGDDTVRLFGAIASVMSRGANMCNLYLAMTGSGGGVIDLARPADWNWRVFDAADYVGALFTDGTPIDRFPNDVLAVPIFVNRSCPPLHTLPDPSVAVEQAKARVAAAATTGQTIPRPAGIVGK